VSSSDTEQFRVALLDERRRVLDAIEHLNAGNGGERRHTDDHHDENASVTLDRELDHTLETNSGHVLAAIDAALEQIELGTFGRCGDCGEPIAPERLEAIPYATQCIDCKRRAERR
jgi:RNA polymerase-binding protein DksA